MTRIVISFFPNEQNQLSFRLFRGPEAPKDRKPRSFPYAPAELPTGKPPPPPTGWVGQYGQRLWNGLLEHPEVKRAFKNALRLSAGKLQPILFHTEDPLAELFNWEMLCEQSGQFLALDGRWPIGRIAEPGVDLNHLTPEFTRPLKLMAVLSALGAREPARQEWSGLYAAVRQARETDMPVKLHVLIGEGHLLENVEALARDDPQLTVEQVRDSATDVQRAIRMFNPHILHFFCHGAADDGQPRLLLGTPQDFEQQRPAKQSTVILQLGDLKHLLAPLGVWLVVLNCCEGGMAVKEVYSLANSLVASGVPAALGMREEIQGMAANEFSRVFYQELLLDLQERLLPDDQAHEVDLDWTKILHTPRKALVEQYNRDAATYGEWTLPVLYTLPPPFKVRVLQPPASPVSPTPPVEWGGSSTHITASTPPSSTRAVPDPGGQRYAAAMMEGLLDRLPPDAPAGMVAELQSLTSGRASLPGTGPPKSRDAGPPTFPEAPHRWQGRRLVDHHGEPLGSIEVIYLDKVTNQPEWVLLEAGATGPARTFVPLVSASEEGDTVRVPFAKALIEGAPPLPADRELSEDQEGELYRHYGVPYSRADSPSGLPAGEAGAGAPTTEPDAPITAAGETPPVGPTGTETTTGTWPGETAAEPVPQAYDPWLKPVGADRSRAKSAAKAGLGALALAGIAGALAALRARRRRPPSLGGRVSGVGRKVAGTLSRAADSISPLASLAATSEAARQAVIGARKAARQAAARAAAAGASKAVAGFPTAGGRGTRRFDLGRRGRHPLKQVRQAVPRRRRRRRMKVMGKLGMVVGAAVGYVLGVKAGRERYEQITASARQLLDKPQVKRVVDSAPGNLGARVEQVANKAADKVAQAGDKVAASGSGTGTTGTSGATTGTTTTTATPTPSTPATPSSSASTTTTPSVPSTSGGPTTVTSGGESGAATTTDTGSTTTKRSSSGERKSKSS